MDKEVILIKILYKKAHDLYIDESYEDSLKLLIQTSEIWFDHQLKHKFLYLQGMNFFKMKNFERAMRIFYELLTLIPRNPKIFFMIGEICYLTGNYKESEKMYSRAKKCDYFNFELTLKTAMSAWKSENYMRMYRRLKEGYIPEIISKDEELKLKQFLLEFLSTSDYAKAYQLVKKFRKWCSFRKKQTLKKPINKGNI